MNGGTVGPKEPKITHASRYIQDSQTEHIEDDNLEKFLKEIYSFKQYFWTEFINNRQSQNPTVIEEYIKILRQMYDCLINGRECNTTEFQSFNASNISLSSLMRTIDTIQSEYWLKRTLIQFPFTLNAN